MINLKLDFFYYFTIDGDSNAEECISYYLPNRHLIREKMYMQASFAFKIIIHSV